MIKSNNRKNDKKRIGKYYLLPKYIKWPKDKKNVKFVLQCSLYFL